MAARFLAMKVVQAPDTAPPRAERRRRIQNWCREFNVPYEEARKMIRDEEAKMRAKGIDPWGPKSTDDKQDDHTIESAAHEQAGGDTRHGEQDRG